MPHIDARPFDDCAVDRRGPEPVTAAPSSPTFRGHG